MTYSTNKSLKMLSWLYLNDGIYSNNDSQVLALYCSGFVKGGQNFKSVAAEISAALNKTPNQAPVFTPTIYVDPKENSARVSMSLGSPQNMFNSGEITFTYTVSTGSGEVIDSGEISNSTSRLQSDWEFDLENLNSGVSYKFSLTMRNIIGSSKMFSANFKTAGERSTETTQPLTTGEDIEQSISILDFPTSMKLTDKYLNLTLNTSSGLDPYVQSLTPTICTIDTFDIIFLRAGRCEFKVSQDGDDVFLPAEDVYGSFVIQGIKSTITCIKGKQTKKISGVGPKCPSGYKLKR
jgi:hypothetical protein